MLSRYWTISLYLPYPVLHSTSPDDRRPTPVDGALSTDDFDFIAIRGSVSNDKPDPRPLSVCIGADVEISTINYITAVCIRSETDVEIDCVVSPRY